MEIESKTGIFGVSSRRNRTVYFGVSLDVEARKRRVFSDYGFGRAGRIVRMLGVSGEKDLDCWVERRCPEGDFAGEMENVVRKWLDLGWTVYGMAVQIEKDEDQWGWLIEYGERMLSLGVSKDWIRNWLSGQIEQMENNRPLE